MKLSLKLTFSVDTHNLRFAVHFQVSNIQVSLFHTSICHCILCSELEKELVIDFQALSRKLALVVFNKNP